MPDTEVMRSLVEALHAMGFTKEHKEFRCALLVIAGMHVGTTPDMLVHITGYPTDFVTSVVVRMKAAGLWSDAREEGWYEWFETHFLTFTALVKLAAGELTPDDWQEWKAHLGSLSYKLYSGPTDTTTDELKMQ